MSAKETLEIEPLIPLSGEAPIAISPANKSQLILKPQEELEMQRQILAQSLPWTSWLLVPILGIGLYWIVRKLKSHDF